VLAVAEADASQRQQTHQHKLDGKAHGARAGAGSAAGGPANPYPNQRGVRPAPPRTPRSGPAALACGSQGQAQGHTPASAAGASAGRSLKRAALPGAGGTKPGAGGARSGSAKGAGAAGGPAASDAGAPVSAVQEKLAKLLQARSQPRALHQACLPCSSAADVASVLPCL